MKRNRILVVGLGPSGLAFLLHSTQKDRSIAPQIMAIDQGEDLSERLALNRRPVDRGELTQGFGGAGLFSDGKFCLSLTVGGRLDKVLREDERRRLEDCVDNTFHSFDGASRITYSNSSAPVALDLTRRGLSFTPYAVRHYGTDQLVELNRRLHTELLGRHIRLSLSTKLIDLQPLRGAWKATMNRGHQNWEHICDTIVLAVGKRGSRWLREGGQKLGLAFEAQPVRFGVRIEAPRDAVSRLLQIGLDPKVFLRVAGHKTKLHCFCDGGELLALDYDGVRVLGGHSLDGEKTSWTNFSVLTESWPHAGQDTAAAALALLRPFTTGYPGIAVKEPLTEFLGDTKDSGRNSTGTSVGRTAVETRIRPLLQEPIYKRIRGFLKRLLEVTGEGWVSEAWVYAPAIEWWYDAIRLNPATMETSVPGIYAIGDGAGWSQGIVHAAATGIRAADALLAAGDLSRVESKPAVY